MTVPANYGTEYSSDATYTISPVHIEERLSDQRVVCIFWQDLHTERHKIGLHKDFPWWSAI